MKNKDIFGAPKGGIPGFGKPKKERYNGGAGGLGHSVTGMPRKKKGVRLLGPPVPKVY